jgi:hypothetical protein
MVHLVWKSQKPCLHGLFLIFCSISSSPCARVIPRPKCCQLQLTLLKIDSPIFNIVRLAWQSQKPCLHGLFLIFRLISSSPRAQVILCPKGCQLPLTLLKIDSPNLNIVCPGWQLQKPCLHGPFFIFCSISSSPHTQVILCPPQAINSGMNYPNQVPTTQIDQEHVILS